MHSYIKRRREEKGSSDIVVILLTLPIVIFLLLSLIDISLYFQARTMVQNVTRDAARDVSVWGGASANSPLNPTNRSVQNQARDRLWDGQQCTSGNCSRSPVVTCTPNQTSRAGQTVSCTTQYWYHSLVPGNPISAFGGLTNASFTITEYARSETGIR